jgi:hypothetical protein
MMNPRPFLVCTLIISGVLGLLSVATTRASDTSTATKWSIVGTPNDISQDLRATACNSTSDCWAVGTYSNGSAAQTLIEHWDGISWKIVDSPNSGGGNNRNFLLSVACSSSSDCWAVGFTDNAGSDGLEFRPLTLHWDGNRWTIETAPSASSGPNSPNQLYSVTCSSSSECWSVGQYGKPYDGTYYTLIERWDGQSWTAVSSPNLPHNDDFTHINSLNGVTCASASDCWAVGSTDTQALVEHWNGSTWTIVTSPSINNVPPPILNSVTCTSSSKCWAVGNYQPIGAQDTQPLIERWDGTSWSIVAAPASRGTGNLSGVACAGASECWAVGTDEYASSGLVQKAIVERWNGTAWKSGTLPDIGKAGQTVYMYGVACGSKSQCFAVGSSPGSSAFQTLIERWNGSSWTVATSPNTSASEIDAFKGTTCTSASDCWAVGYSSGPMRFGSSALIEHWNGTSWMTVDSAAVAGPLESVACTSASKCWAVGYHLNDNGVQQTLIGQWDGSAWNSVGSPNATTSDKNVLQAITCASSAQCWAVGYSHNGKTSVDQTLIEHWDGSSWSIVTSRNPSAVESSYLNGIVCSSISQCWAVGYQDVGNGGSQETLIEEWDGSTWNIVRSPNTASTQNNVLQAVTCVSPSQCWAVGNSHNIEAGVDQTLIQRWNGTSWSIVTSPNTAGREANVLEGITCPSTSQCWAVGYFNIGDTSNTLIEAWDGTSWKIASSPNTSNTQNNLLSSVTCAAASDCWAVGYYATNPGKQPLVERSSTSSTPTPLAQLLNISTRMEVLNGDNVLIGGFIVTGTQPKRVLVRALGPSLPVSGALADPVLELHDSGNILATNDDWKVDDKTGQSQQPAIQATTIPPKNDLESALIATVPANNAAYTAIVRSKNGGTGVGQVEVYDLETAADSQLANISTRGFVDSGDSVMIGGVIAGPNGAGSTKVLLRAIGPSLGISGELADPTVELHNASGTTIATNDNWKVDDNTGASQQVAIEATTIPPKNNLESALIETLIPGNYTAIVRGKNSTTGIGLVEVYNLR